VKAHVAVIGGGITGLTAAYTLLKQGVHVTVFEAQTSLGGLSSTFDFGPFRWDRFYHCILTSDQNLLGLVDELGLSSRLRWRKTEVGFYSRGHLHCMTRPVDLLRFPCLSLASKFRFGLGILYSAYMCRGEGLESVPLKDWVIRIFGQRLFREMWEPLLRCKLGDMRSEASAAFLWSTIRRLYSTRGKGVEKTEQLGYVEGGYRVVLDRLVEEIQQLGGRLYSGAILEKVEATEDGIGIAGQGAFREFDACLMTVPSVAILRMVPSLSEEYKTRLSMPKYLGIVCVVLVLRRSLSPYYLTNVTDDVPFTGIVEMTNLIDRRVSTSGRSLVYLPKYTSPSDPLFQLSDEEVWDRFTPALFKIHPELKLSEIESMHIFRERFVQPVPTLDYSQRAPTVSTGIPHLFVANSTQIVNDTLNNNAMTRIARNACAVLMHDLADQASARRSRADARPRAVTMEVRI
jgi:protoporphyrinogen oxidase